jgi:hypothetical protein
MSDQEAEPIPASELEGIEGWRRFTDEPELRDVEVVRYKDSGHWQWSIFVSVMEFVRSDPLESELREAMAKALRAVPGATDVAEEDREEWVVDGEPSGKALAEAAAATVDAFAPQTRAHTGFPS